MNASDYLDEQLAAPAPASAEDYLAQQLAPTIDTTAAPTGNAADYSGGRGFMMGLRAPVDAGAQMLTHALPEKLVNKANEYMGSFAPTASQLDKQISDASGSYNADRTAAGKTGIDWPYIAGNTLSTAPLAAVAPELEGAPLLAKAANVLGQGYAYGTLAPVTDKGDFWGQKNKQGEIGAVLNGIMAPAASAVSKVISPNTSSEVKTLMNEGVTPTMGQILGGSWKTNEEKMTSIPFVGDMIKNAQNRSANDLNTAVANRALEPIGETITAKPGREMVEEVSNKLSAAYNDLLPKLNFTPDAQFAAEVQKTTQMAQFLPDQQTRQFQKIVGTQLNKLKNGANGETLKGIESELTNYAKGYSSDPSFDNRKLGDAVNEVVSSIRGNLQRTNPEYAERLSNINKGYANYAILRKAASNLGSSEGVGVFSPAQLQSAVKSADKSVAKGNFARGNARMQDLSDSGISVMGGKYPDSGTAGRAALGMGGAALGGMLHPAIPAAAFAGAAPYTKTGQSLMAALLTKRPDFSAPMAQAIAKSQPYFAGGAIPYLTGPYARQAVPFSLNGGFK